VIPLREPEAVNLRARLRPGMTPSDMQELLEKELKTPLRDAPRITLEELDGEEVVVRISATPRIASEGRQLASELLAIVSRETRAGAQADSDARARSAGDGSSEAQARSGAEARTP
jgi:small conductance mechanosensitive channel